MAVHALAHVPPLRDFFLHRDGYAKFAKASPLVAATGDLICSIWSPRRFKATLTPLELMSTVAEASRKRFSPVDRCDVITFLAWYLNELHRGLGGTKAPGSSIIHKCFQGLVEVHTRTTDTQGEPVPADSDATAKGARGGPTPFLFLSLDLPESPLFKDAKAGETLVHKVPLEPLLEKFDGVTETTELVRAGRLAHKRYRIVKLPPFLILHLKRFSQNTWSVEKNPALVQVPVHRLDLSHMSTAPTSAASLAAAPGNLPSPRSLAQLSLKQLISLARERQVDTSRVTEKPDLIALLDASRHVTYGLVANICHVSTKEDRDLDKNTTTNSNPLTRGTYRVQVRNRAKNQWVEIEDLHISDTMPQLVAQSDSYVCIFERGSLAGAL